MSTAKLTAVLTLKCSWIRQVGKHIFQKKTENWRGQIETPKVKLSHFLCRPITMFRSHAWNIHVSKFIIWNLLPGGGCLSQYSSNCKMKCKAHQSGLHVTHTHFTDQVKYLFAFIYMILFLICHLFNRQTNINECQPIYVHGLVAFFFFWFPEKMDRRFRETRE